MIVKLLTYIRALLKATNLLSPAKRLVGFLLDPRHRWLPESVIYKIRGLLEKATYADCETVHDLPPIFHYWSNQYLLPHLIKNGINNLDDFFLRYLRRAFAQKKSARLRFLSIGAGNCDFEIQLCKELWAEGHRDFTMACLDFNKDALDRGATAAAQNGMSSVITPLLADFNIWSPDGQYDCIIANQSLHHVVNLEGLFDAIKLALQPTAAFVTSDMIGRNGHVRWPEAKAIIDKYWPQIPEAQRFNHIAGRRESEFRDPPPSPGNFEGVRAQDILGLLVERFQFEFFFGFSNIVAPFFDRTFGPNFDPTNVNDKLDRHDCGARRK